MTTLTLAKALNAGLRRALADDEKVVLMGEDIGALGGVFRVTDGLKAEFGAHRVVDTPLSEAGIVGTAVGPRVPRVPPGRRDPVRRVHLPGVRPDRRPGREAALPLARQRAHADHDPRAVRRRHRRGRAPLRVARGVLRAHGRPARRRVLEPRRRVRHDAAGDRERRPRALLRAEAPLPRQGRGRRDGEPRRRAARWASPRRSRTGRDVTLVTYGALVQTARDAAIAAAEDGVSIEVIDLRSLAPVDYATDRGIRAPHRPARHHARGRPAGRRRRRGRGERSPSAASSTSRPRPCASPATTSPTRRRSSSGTTCPTSTASSTGSTACSGRPNSLSGVEA